VGQDFASAALDHFNIQSTQPKPATADDDTHTDNDPEEGEIVKINTHTTDDGGVVDVTDDMIVD
jgi:hypothetical protein